MLGLIIPSPLRAQNPGTAFNISGTAGFETGLQTLAYIQPPILREQGRSGVNINWGDGTGGWEGLIQTLPGDQNYWVYGTHLYEQPGTYAVTISYDWDCGLFCGAHAELVGTATITPPGKFVILSIGDSVASGEGNPSVRHRSGLNGRNIPDWSFWDDAYSNYELNPFPFPPDEKPIWTFPCHRSGWAGPAQAARQLAATKTNPDPDITFIHYACSGATIAPGDTAAGFAQDAMNQLKIARERLAKFGAGIDILLISAGANSLYGPGANSFGNGFGDIIQHCLFDACRNNNNVISDLNSSFKNLPVAYERLARQINCEQPEGTKVQDPDPGCTDPQKQIPKLVLITEYMDPTRNRDGNYPFSLFECPPLFKAEFGDWQFFHNSILAPLNAEVNDFPGWAQNGGLNVPTYAVTGIASEFLTHGICSGDNRWVDNGNDSKFLLGGNYPHPGAPGSSDLNGTAHPNSAVLASTLGHVGNPTPSCPPSCGHEVYARRIAQDVIRFNPPVSTISAIAGGASYMLGTWTNQPVEVSLSASNPIPAAGVGATYYAVDNKQCGSSFATQGDLANVPGCTVYSSPFTISSSGKHTVTFFSVNSNGFPIVAPAFMPGVPVLNPPISPPVTLPTLVPPLQGILESAQVWIDTRPPLQAEPGRQIMRRGQSAVYDITVGHAGWDSTVVSLSCETDMPGATCSVKPDSVSLNATNTATATVARRTGSALLIAPKGSSPDTPFGPLAPLRALLALATVGFLVAMGPALRRRRWVHVGNFAALAVAFGLLFAGCDGGKPDHTYNVHIHGTSGSSTHTVDAVVIAQ